MHLDPDTRLGLVGTDGLGDAELLSFLLTRGGPPGLASLDLARDVLKAVGGLGRLTRMPEGRLVEIPGIGPTKARRIVAMMALASRAHERPIPRGEAILTPRQVYELLRGRAHSLVQERFWVISRDKRGRRIALREVARGGPNVVHVSPSEIFREPLLEGADNVLIAHNHPSGDPRPSAADVALTQRIAAVGDLLGVPLQDHVVLGQGAFTSLRELGHLPAAPVGFDASAADALEGANDEAAGSNQ